MLQSDLDTGLGLIAMAQEKERDERLFQQWVAQLPIMSIAGKPIGFAAYKDKVTGANIDRRPAAVILRELEDIETQLRGEASADGP